MSIPCLIQLIQDPAWVMYFLCIIVSGFATMLFVWWGFLQVRSVSEVYYFITLLLAANTISDMIALYSRTLYILDHPAFLIFSSGPIWWFRRVPETIIILMIIFKMIQRIKKVVNEVNRFQM
jgi:hypothetical protein